LRIVSLCLALLASPAAAHEFWIEPEAWQVGTEDAVRGRLLTGDDFAGSTETPYLPERFERFEVYAGSSTTPVRSEADSRPALQVGPLPEGLAVVAFVSSVFGVLYDDKALFDRYVADKGLGAIASLHEARGLPDRNFAEAFSRHAKALIAVGDGAGSDFRVGLETEMVALDNPYADDLDGYVRVQLHAGETVRADAQVELFARSPEGEVEMTLHRTDSDGIVTLPVRAGHDYLANAVMLRDPLAGDPETDGAAWESLWASLTFSVPADQGAQREGNS